MGIVEGAPQKRIITNISALMDSDYCKFMEIIKKEADAGAFSTKKVAVRRRDELIRAPAATAELAAAAEPDATSELPGLLQAADDAGLEGSQVPDVWPHRQLGSTTF